MASREEVVEIVNMVGAAYPWVNMTADTISVWSLVLQDVDGNTAKAAALELLNQPSQYPPSVGMIRQKAFDLATGSDDGWESGWQAWKQHLRECRAPEYLCPHNPDDVFDPVTAHVIRAFGWQTLARMDQDQEATIRAQFRDVWRTTAQRQAEHARRHPAVQYVIDSYRQQLEVTKTPRIEAPAMTTPSRQQELVGVIGDIETALKRDGRPRRAEFDQAVAKYRRERGM